MGSAGPGQTTIPSRAAGVGHGASAAAAIRWVFPEPQLTQLRAPSVLLGRGDDCDGVLPGRETSRHHARIQRDGPIWILRDLASRNGVFLNGKRCSEAPLSWGDVLRLGEWIGVLESNCDEELGAARELAPGLWGGARLRAAVEPAQRAAGSELPIIVEGETGTGKECVARAIHEWSKRAGDFVAVNCAALPESLAEAELFGHRKGAFTGASRDAPGYFRAAHRGTLLLDEIVDLPPAIQAKLLRVIETGEVTPLGDTRPIRVDVRLVAAAQSSLAEAVAAKRFRADLRARLEGVSLVLPPLRARRDDVPGLFLHLLERHSGGHPPGVDATLIERLCLHVWPYNVRELVQLVRRMLALHADAPILTEMHLSGSFLERKAEEPPMGSPLGGGGRERRDAALGERLTEALARHAGNVTKAAEALGISRQRAYRLLKRRGGVDLDALRFPDASDGDDG